MSHPHASAKLPIAKGAAAKSALGCPSAGGQQANGLSHRALAQSSVRASESLMAQSPTQRFKGHQCLVAQSFGSKPNFIQHRLPNPAVKRTVNGVAGSAAFTSAVPPLPSAYLQR
jgi:hypothetical protein